MYCIDFHLLNSLPVGHSLWVCVWCDELLAIREQTASFEAKVANLEKLRESEEYVDETFRSIIEMSCIQVGALLLSWIALGKEDVNLGKREIIL